LELHQLIPEDHTVEALDLLAGLRLEQHADEQRPYTVVNFVSSADGRAAFHGGSGPLGDETDRQLFLGLREQAEAVLVGTGTLRVERYRRLVSDPERRRRRIRAGRSPEPLACVVTRTGDVPTEAPLFSEPEMRIVVFGPPGLELGGCEAQVEVVQLDPGELTLTAAMRRLRGGFGIRSLLCEGGPTLFSGLLSERLVDELFLTLAPKLAGGDSAPGITSGPELPELAPLTLVWALEDGGSLYLRYRLG
jgi:5-amino-6-(5-phosphoribosylamino)uracil reductase